MPAGVDEGKEMTANSPALEHADAKNDGLRLISPRRSLPSGRALVGALLITIAAVGAYVTATRGSDVPSTEFLVVTSPIAAGQPVSLDLVAFEPMDIPVDVARGALNSTEGLDGAISLRDLRPGEILGVDDLLASPTIDGYPIGAVHELSFPVPLDRTPRDLIRGDRVTILSSLRVGDIPTTMVALEDAIVIAFDPRTDQIGATGTGVLTLSIPDAESVMSTTHLSRQGDLTIVRSTRAIEDQYPTSFVLNSVSPGEGAAAK